ncbi:MAG: site-2 protease family protein [Methanotrichaceae archaeon]|nr:site-2 protease family protein [Methanotrichaceae archaeon]
MNPLQRISRLELTDLLLSLIALTIGFAIIGESGIPGWEVFLISAFGVGTGFLLHEMAHKFVAQEYGYWAEYRANRLGLIVIIVMAQLGFILAAPGAVMIRKDSPEFAQDNWSGYDESGEYMEKKASSEMLRISIAGPMTNIVLMCAFFVLLSSGLLTSYLSIAAVRYAFFINLILAGFNLIPFGPLDGAKVYQANRLVWAVVAVPTLLLALPVFFGISLI